MMSKKNLIVIAIFFSSNFISMKSSQVREESSLGCIRREMSNSGSDLEAPIGGQNSDVLVFGNDKKEHSDMRELALSSASPVRPAVATLLHVLSSESNVAGQTSPFPDIKKEESVISGNPAMSTLDLDENGASRADRAQAAAVFHLASTGLGNDKSMDDLSEDKSAQSARGDSGLVTPIVKEKVSALVLDK